MILYPSFIDCNKKWRNRLHQRMNQNTKSFYGENWFEVVLKISHIFSGLTQYGQYHGCGLCCRQRNRCITLQCRHNKCDGVSNRQPHDCYFMHLLRPRSKKTSKLRVTGLCAGNSPMTGEFPTQKASNAENVSNWWRHHELLRYLRIFLGISTIFHNLNICNYSHIRCGVMFADGLVFSWCQESCSFWYDGASSW